MSEARFSGKQVFGIVLAVLVVLALGLSVGGVVGYQLGRADASRNVQAQPPAAAQAPQSAAPQTAPRDDSAPDSRLPDLFGQIIPNIFRAGGPYLGVEFEMLTPELAASEGITGTTGAIIRSVVPDSPADKAGLKVGEVITAVDGQAVDEEHSLLSRVQEYQAGDEVKLTVATGSANGPIDQRDVTVTLGKRPASQSFSFQLPAPFNDDNGQQRSADGPYLGVEFEMLTPELAASEGLTGTTGALIRTVMAGSPAAGAGLKRGEVVTEVNGKALDETYTLRDAVQAQKVGDAITLTMIKGTASGSADRREVKVTLAARPVQRRFQMPLDPNSRSG